ncbi:hypothetical protein O3M35_005853 [Rhynocoris fuscipes]|uniref:Protein regulator of cytokinesis 1 n=1 Tax=Rhynocoris fuscipes TaxID=488301 RepID=A0AAW1DJP8_9HEMI
MDTDRENLFLNETSELTKTYSRKISELYQRMYGFNHDKSLKIYSYFANHLKDFYEDLLSSCQTKMDEFEKEAEEKYLEYERLLKELNMSSDISIDGSEPLNAIIEKLNGLLSGLLVIKNERVSRYKELLEKETRLCNILGEMPFPTVPSTPSEQQLSTLQRNLENLETEKLNRIQTLKNLKESIVCLIKEIEFEDSLPFHNDIINSTEETFNLNTEYIERVKKFEAELKTEKQTAIKNIEYLKEKLNKLWYRIKMDDNYRSTFLMKINGVGKSYQNLLKSELERCEVIKRANIEPVIKSVRLEIQEMWDKLTYTQEQRMSFIAYISDSFSDELLTLHELELQKLQAYYEENRHIYELAEKRESLWKRMLHLDNVANDKNRFKNRGGQLLKEEKERKILENSLPKTDSQLRQYLLQYEMDSGKTFLWHGEDLLRKITDDWENRQAGKESKKLTKKKENNVASSGANHENVPPSGSKRKCEATSTENIPHWLAKRIPNPNSARLMNDHLVPNDAGNAAEPPNSYHLFKEELNENNIASCNKRNAFKELNTPGKSAHSSPVKCRTPRTPGSRRGNVRRCLQ